MSVCTGSHLGSASTGMHVCCPPCGTHLQVHHQPAAHPQTSILADSFVAGPELCSCGDLPAHLPPLHPYPFPPHPCPQAHRLKNDATQTNRTLDGLACKRRVLLSGTPMQNHLDEVREFWWGAELLLCCSTSCLT
jgi:hypothetical protein